MLVPGFLWTSHHVPFFFAVFALYHFDFINLSHLYSYIVGFENPSESPNLEIVYWTSSTTRMFIGALFIITKIWTRGRKSRVSVNK